MTRIEIGRLDRRLLLQEAVRTADGAGGAAVAWSPVVELWAAVREVGGGERQEAEGLKARLTHEVWIRHRAGVRPDMRFIHGSRVLDVRSVQEAGGRRRYLKCLCEERVT